LQRLFDVLRWTPDRMRKVHAHHVTEDEVEEAVFDNVCNIIKRVGRNNVVRYNVFGCTLAGRPLMVVLAPEGNRIGGPITARDADANERRKYFNGRP
jgi:uncharacterized DUF497 family protein